ncbi:MAG: VOC family protein [Hyphomicrobiaceae bacterium]|nr:VOC family protein [Hyphomicrobiaceae bacterium]
MTHASTLEKPRKGGKSKPKAAAAGGDLQPVTPHLVCAAAAEAIAFYKQAFGATEVTRLAGKNGKLMHAAIEVGGARIMLMDEAPEWGALGPKALKGTPVTIHLYVDDVDGVLARAVAAGATLKMPAADMFWGDRYGVVIDPFGHSWSIATRLRDMSPEEIRAAMATAPVRDGERAA